MLKQAWRSYLASLHPRYLRKAYDKGAIFMLIYWFVIYPMIMNAVSDTLEFYDVMILMFMRMIPFLLMEWSNINSKYLMSKVMYLSPMKEQEREEYIKNVLFIKIGMTILLGMSIEVVWGIFTGIYWEKVFIVILANLSMGIATYISSEKHGINIFMIVITVLIMAFIAFLEIGAEESLAIFSNWFILIAGMILLGLDIWIVRKKYQETIALACEYELTFKIESKQELRPVKFDLFEKKR